MKRRSALQHIALGTGAAISGVAFTAFISSCKNEISETWKPSFLSTLESEVVEEIIAIILPQTETPGAKELKVIKTVDNVLDRLYKAREQDHFRTGLGIILNRLKLDPMVERSKIDFGEIETFVNKNLGFENEEELEKFNELARTTLSDDDKPGDEVLFAKALYNIKSLGINAYFKDPSIATEFLNYDPVPGVYLGCIPVEEVGNSWSL